MLPDGSCVMLLDPPIATDKKERRDRSIDMASLYPKHLSEAPNRDNFINSSNNSYVKAAQNDGNEAITVFPVLHLGY